MFRFLVSYKTEVLCEVPKQKSRLWIRDPCGGTVNERYVGKEIKRGCVCESLALRAAIAKRSRYCRQDNAH